MSKYILIATTMLVILACGKDVSVPELPCLPQAADPHLRTYSCDSVTEIHYSSKLCGLLPIGPESHWIYLDSIFAGGQFLRVEHDTLRFTSKMRSTDGLIWWESTKFVGIPELVYANDSAIFLVEPRMFAQPCVLDVRKEYFLFQPDSIQYLTRFGDEAAIGKAKKVKAVLQTPAGDFANCIYFEKHARDVRRDRIYFKPGLGVVKYYHEIAPPNEFEIKLQRISTLLSYHSR